MHADKEKRAIKSLPERHGRLIDADFMVLVLQHNLEELSKCADNDFDKGLKKMMYEFARDFVNQLPTIVEAEGTE